MREVLSVCRPGPGHPLLLEEFIVGREPSYDTVSVGGDVVWHNISDYTPTPLEVMENDWIQWTVLLPRRIGLRMRRRREELRWSQDLASERIGLHPTTLRELEAGRANPSLVVLCAIADAYRMQLVELLSP